MLINRIKRDDKQNNNPRSTLTNKAGKADEQYEQ